MKSIAILCCLLAFTVCVQCLTEPDIRGCLAELNIKVEDLPQLEKTHSPKLDCLHACFMQKVKQIDAKGMLSLEAIEKAELHHLRECVPKANKVGKDRCDRLMMFHKCMMESEGQE